MLQQISSLSRVILNHSQVQLSTTNFRIVANVCRTFKLSGVCSFTNCMNVSGYRILKLSNTQQQPVKCTVECYKLWKCFSVSDLWVILNHSQCTHKCISPNHSISQFIVYRLCIIQCISRHILVCLSIHQPNTAHIVHCALYPHQRSALQLISWQNHINQTALCTVYCLLFMVHCLLCTVHITRSSVWCSHVQCVQCYEMCSVCMNDVCNPEICFFDHVSTHWTALYNRTTHMCGISGMQYLV